MMFIMNKVAGLEGIIWAQPVADAFCIILAAVMFRATTKKLEKEAKLETMD